MAARTTSPPASPHELLKARLPVDVLFWQNKQAMVCALFLFLAERSSEEEAVLPRYFAHGPEHKYRSGRRELQPRAWHFLADHFVCASKMVVYLSLAE